MCMYKFKGQLTEVLWDGDVNMLFCFRLFFRIKKDIEADSTVKQINIYFLNILLKMVILRSIINVIYVYPYYDDIEMKCNTLIDCKIFGSDNVVTQLFVTSNKCVPHKAVLQLDVIKMTCTSIFKFICIPNIKKIITFWNCCDLYSRWKNCRLVPIAS